ncbi:MAG: hypothetical protein A2Y09_06870 [Planctomycetes bacterium GWA2_39_15]|nr:MAG: hypothetical protein A2Y09_06870 [Planctomycetes bacterium GWA2_39_15]
MDVFFTTVVRQAPITQGGELVRVDWTTKKVIAKKPLIPTDPPITEKDDPNSRGNARGGRGIIRQGDTLYVAIYHSILLFNTALNSKGKITNNLFVGLHEMYHNEDTVWLASTAIDGAIHIDLQGNLLESWWPRENRKLQQLFALDSLPINKTIDNRMLWLHVQPSKQPGHTHLNAVAVRKGQMCVLLNRFGLVYNTITDSILIEDPSIIGCHNLVFLGDKILINDSKGKRVVVYSQDGKFINEIDLLSFPEILAIHNADIDNYEEKRRLFVRGLSPIDDKRILVGFSPATIVEIELYSGRLLDVYQYSKDVAVCVHGLLAWT